MANGQNERRAAEEELVGVLIVPGVRRAKASVVTAAMVAFRYVAELHVRIAVDPPHSQCEHSPEPDLTLRPSVRWPSCRRPPFSPRPSLNVLEKLMIDDYP